MIDTTTTRIVTVGRLQAGDRIVQAGSVFRGAIVTAAPRWEDAGHCPCRCARVLLADGRVMDTYGWDDVITIAA